MRETAIVIVSYRTGDTLAQCLDAALGQAEGTDEVIIQRRQGRLLDGRDLDIEFRFKLLYGQWIDVIGPG